MHRPLPMPYKLQMALRDQKLSTGLLPRRESTISVAATGDQFRAMIPSSANSNNAKCHLLALPPELRNRIYELLLIGASPVDICRRSPRSTVRSPKLLQVCRKIRAEALGMYYGCNVFEVLGRSYFLPWLESLTTKSRKLLKNVRVHESYNVPRARGEAEWKKTLLTQTKEDIGKAGLGVENLVLEINVVLLEKGREPERFPLWEDDWTTFWSSDPVRLVYALDARDALDEGWV